MARTFKDNPNYLKGVKRKERRSKKFHQHKEGNDLDWLEDHPVKTSREPYYKCIERKLPVFYDDPFIEDLIDTMDSQNDFKNEAA